MGNMGRRYTASIIVGLLDPQLWVPFLCPNDIHKTKKGMQQREAIGYRMPDADTPGTE
jgi:hypothetical protein